MQVQALGRGTLTNPSFMGSGSTAWATRGWAKSLLGCPSPLGAALAVAPRSLLSTAPSSG